MSFKYLNDSGLAYFWTKIKAYVVGLLSNYLPLSGGKLTGIAYLSPGSGEYKTDYAIGDTYSSNIYMTHGFYDKNNSKLADVLYYLNSSSDYESAALVLRVFGNPNNPDWNFNGSVPELGLRIDASGDPYGYCPTPVLDSNSTAIATTRWVRTATGDTTLNAASSTKVSATVAAGSDANLVEASVAGSDRVRIRTGGASDAGYLEIATADNGTEPIRIAQYSGNFATEVRHATLLAGDGNTVFPGILFNYTQHVIRHSTYVRGDEYTANRYLTIEFKDKNDNGLADILYYLNTPANGGEAAIVFRVFGNPNAENSTTHTMGLVIGSSGNSWGYCPTHPYTTENSNVIATTAWVRSATGNTSLNAATATKLATARSLKTKLDSTAAVSFDGSAAQDAIPVTGTLGIGNGGTGATTRLNALKALTNEGMTTSNAKYFLMINDSWANGGYLSVADVKTVLGLGSAAYTASADYVAKSGDTMTGALTATRLTATDVCTTSQFVKMHGGVTKGTAVSESKYWTLTFSDNAGFNYTNNCLGLCEGRLDSSNRMNVYLRALKNTTASTSNVEIGVTYDTVNNKGWAYITATPEASSNDTKIPTTAWVRTFCDTTQKYMKAVSVTGSGNAVTDASLANGTLTLTKGTTFLTSHQSLSNYVTLNTAQTISGAKTFSDVTHFNGNNGIRFYQPGVEYNVIPSSNQYCNIRHADKNNKNLGRMLWWWNSSANGGERGFSFDICNNGSDSYVSMFSMGVSNTNARYFTFSGALSYVQPYSDTVTLGRNATNRRWAKIYAVDTTISTSDERAKDSIQPVPDSVLDAWESIDWLQFRMKSAVAEKGDSARLHNGLVAQRIDSVFRESGLDASRYGLFCYDKWEAEKASLDEDGSEIVPALDAGDAYSVRYAEALCMEAAFQRRENARLKKRVADLEERLAVLELKVS